MENNPRALKLFEDVVQKTKSGRIQWQPTANEDLFIAAIGGQFTLALEIGTEDQWGNRPPIKLSLKDDTERRIFTVTDQIEGVGYSSLDDLLETVRRQANKVDDKIDQLLGALSRL